MSVVGILGSRPIAAAFAAVTSTRLRAVAYHAVEDARAFATQLDWFAAAGYRTVTAAQVAGALHSGAPLPARSLWLTFDDGDATVVRVALPLLRERGMVATAFLCGAWVDTTEAPWWQVVAAAVAPDDLVRTRLALKAAPDAQRRARVAQMAESLAASDSAVTGSQWTEADVHAWLAAGNDIGNHSWDHPCLDRCDDVEQRRQIEAAHDRLSALVGHPLDVFAWPNGDPADVAATALRSLGYRLLVECDHRLTGRGCDPLAVSRLKLDTSADLTRTRAILSGAHSAVFHLQQRFRRKGPTDDVT